MSLVTVFDAAHPGYGVWLFPAYGLPFVAAGAVMALRPGLLASAGPFRAQGTRIFSWLFFMGSVGWVVFTSYTTYAHYRSAADALAQGRYEVVEGTVADFVPMPYEGHSAESFVVNGDQFSYSDYVLTGGFNNTASHGGPMHDGLHVRVSYVGNLILRLEVEP